MDTGTKGIVFIEKLTPLWQARGQERDTFTLQLEDVSYVVDVQR